MISSPAYLLSAITSEHDCMLCWVDVANVGGTEARGDYEVKLYSRSRRDRRGRLVKTARVENYDRNGQAAWHLMAAAYAALESEAGLVRF